MIQIRKYILLTVALFALTTAMAQDLEDSIKVHYRLEESKLDLSYKNNGITLDSLARILNIRNADTTNILQQVYIIGRASPEGNWDFNYRLSQKRAASMLEHLNKITEIPDSLITSKHIVQDWNLLLYLVERDSAVPYQDEVIELIRQYKGEETNAAPNTTLFNKLRSSAVRCICSSFEMIGIPSPSCAPYIPNPAWHPPLITTSVKSFGRLVLLLVYFS